MENENLFTGAKVKRPIPIGIILGFLIGIIIAVSSFVALIIPPYESDVWGYIIVSLVLIGAIIATPVTIYELHYKTHLDMSYVIYVIFVLIYFLSAMMYLIFNHMCKCDKWGFHCEESLQCILNHGHARAYYIFSSLAIVASVLGLIIIGVIFWVLIKLIDMCYNCVKEFKETYTIQPMNQNL